MVGGYEILGLLGRGGMGEVYRARQVSMQRIVALKILAPTLAQKDPAFAKRFVDEARAAGRFNNPSIIHVHDVSRCAAPEALRAQGIEHLDCFSMELVEGESVQAVLDRQGPLEVALIAKIMAGMASALSYAEQEGIVHRDIKPDNIMLGNDGTVKLADLGLAQPVADQSLPEQDRDEQGRLKVMGTPLYMSPQQARAQPVDHRSDQYSLGATLWHLLAGRPPYRGPDNRATMIMHVRDPIPDPRDVIADAPEAWSLLAMRLMAKDPAHRFATSTQLKDAIRSAAKGIAPDEPDDEGPASPRPALPWKLVGSLTIGAVVLGGLLWMLARGGHQAPPAELPPKVAPSPTPAPVQPPAPKLAPPVPVVAPVPAPPPLAVAAPDPWRELSTALQPLRANLDYLKVKNVVEAARSSLPAAEKARIDALVELGALASRGESAVRAFILIERPAITVDGAAGKLSRLSLAELTWLDATNSEHRSPRAGAALPWADLLAKALADQQVERLDEVRAATLWMWRQPEWNEAATLLQDAPLAQALRALE